MFCLIVGSSCTPSIPSSSTAYAIGSVSPDPKTIAETPMFHDAGTTALSVASTSPSRSNCGLVAPCEELQEEWVRVSNASISSSVGITGRC